MCCLFKVLWNLYGCLIKFFGIVFMFSSQYKHYKYTRTLLKNERGAGTPKNPNIGLGVPKVV